MTTFTVCISDDRTVATMIIDRWSLACVVGDLPKWLALYRQLAGRKPQYRHHYEPGVRAIENAMRQLGMDTSERSK